MPTQTTSHHSLIQDTFEFVDIFSQVFQFMEIREIYPLQRVSGFFYRMIEKLKETYIRPVYEIGIVALNEDQLQNFITKFLNQGSNNSNLSSSPSSPAVLKKYPPVPSDYTVSDNFTDEIASISEIFSIYEKYERQFIFKQDRFRVSFFPIICHKHGSLGRDELNRLEGFIFLSPEFTTSYSFMPEGVDICAVVLDDHFYSSTHFTKDSEKDQKDRGLGFVKNRTTEPMTFTPLKKIKMPVFEFGTVAIEEKVYKYQEESLVQCIMYIVNHSNRCLDLDHSLSNNNTKQPKNDEQQKGSQKLMEKISQLIKLKDEQLIISLKKLFRNRFDYYNLLATDNLVYMTKRLCFFHIPLDAQMKLLNRLYETLVKNTPSLLVNNGKVKTQSESDYILVQYKQLISNEELYYGYGSYDKKKGCKDVRLVSIKFYYGEKIEFEYTNGVGSSSSSSGEEKKCTLQ